MRARRYFGTAPGCGASGSGCGTCGGGRRTGEGASGTGGGSREGGGAARVVSARPSVRALSREAAPNPISRSHAYRGRAYDQSLPTLRVSPRREFAAAREGGRSLAWRSVRRLTCSRSPRDGDTFSLFTAPCLPGELKALYGQSPSPTTVDTVAPSSDGTECFPVRN